MILDALFPRSAKGYPPDHDFWYTPNPYALSGEVTPNSSMQVPTVLGCVRVLAETMGQLPAHLMVDDGQKRRKAIQDPLYSIIHDQPNERQTSIEFRETIQAHLALRGNGYALIKRGARGVEQLIPLEPDRIEAFLLRLVVDDNSPSMGRLGYIYTDRFERQYKLTQDEVLHIRSMSLDGIVGESPISLCRKAVELAMQSEKHGLMWWKNAAKPGGIIKFPEGQWLDEPAHARLKKSWREAHTADDLYTVAILEGGGEWQAMGISNEDSEWLASRRFQNTEICRMFRVPVHMVALAIEHGHTYANVEQSDLDFVKHTMLPWIVKWEQAFKRDIIIDPRQYLKFSLDGLLRADNESRAKFYREMWEIAVFSTNDILELEDRDPVEGGDARFVPMNFVRLGGQAGMIPSPPSDNQDQDNSDNTDDGTGRDGELDAVRSWIDDAAGRIAGAEIRELERKVADGSCGDDFASWAGDFWSGRHAEYVAMTVSPILAHSGCRINALSLAYALGEDAVRELVVSAPPVVLKNWKQRRARDLADRIYTDVCQN